MTEIWPAILKQIEEKLDPGDAGPTAIQTLNTNALLFAMLISIKELSARVAELVAEGVKEETRPPS